MDAGTSFNTDLVLTELPTILTGVSSLVLLKASTMLVATRVPRWMEPNRLTPAEGIKVALLLAGGGEFAFVVLAVSSPLLISHDRLIKFGLSPHIYPRFVINP